MLYISARNNKLTYTGYQALTMHAAEDGGVIVPIRFPYFDRKDLRTILNLSFGACAAEILGKFFSLSQNRSQIISCFNSAVPTYCALDRRTLLVNYHDSYVHSSDNIEDEIYALMANGHPDMPTMPRCAIRIALIFGLFSQLKKFGLTQVDIAVSSAELCDYLPAIFCKEMGLPIKRIICGSSNDDGLWNYMRKEIASNIVFSAVVSDSRANDIIHGLKSTIKQDLSLESAFAYGALQDYRAITGENDSTIILN